MKDAVAVLKTVAAPETENSLQILPDDDILKDMTGFAGGKAFRKAGKIWRTQKA